MTLAPEQLKHFESRLVEERAYALETLNGIVDVETGNDEQDRAGDISKFPTHPADLGTDTIDQELATSNATRVSREVAEIDAALVRLRTAPARFGICEDTGKPIPLARLEIIPWARTCEREKP